MAIGVFSLVIGVICVAVSAVGIKDVERPIKNEKKIEFPYPEEI